jgi:GNAT superfamily N-acetyltransferase
MTRYAVRVATSDDITAVAALRRGWTEEYAGEAIEDHTFDAAFAEWSAREQNQRVTWLAEIDGRPVGMLNMVVFTRMPRPVAAGAPPSTTQWGYIANVYVEAAARNVGIGAALVDAAIRHADEHRFARLVLSPSEQAVPLYERAGFTPATSLMVRPGTAGWH